MKKIIKYSVWAIVLVALLTLTQSVTLSGIGAVEKEFWTTVFKSPKDFINTVILWKYVVLVIAVLLILISSITLLAKRGNRKDKKQKPVTNVRAKKVVTEPVQQKQEAKPAPRGKFTRVVRK